MKIAMVGNASSIAGFRALGVDTFVVPRPEEAPEVWRRIELDEYAVIFVTDDLLEALAEELKPVERLALPVVTAIPPVSGSAGGSYEQLKELVEKAVGTDLLSGE